MGQNSSRQHRQSEPARDSLRNNSTNSDSHPTNSSSGSTLSSDTNFPPQPGPSRRTSVRRSFLNLITPSVRNRADSSTSSLRKSWRHSRRLSKAPSSDAHPNSQPFDASEAPMEPISAVTEKGEDLEKCPESSSADLPVTVDSHSSLLPIITPSTDSSNNPEEPTKEVHKEIDGGQSAGEVSPENSVQGEVDTMPEPVPGPSALVQPPTTTAEANASESPAELSQEQPANDPAPTVQQSQTLGRQFPPPGTLVVVQGVVHTTDVPRPNTPPTTAETSFPRSSSLPPNPSHENTRNTLSSLLRSRPASTIAPHPSSYFETPSSSPNVSTAQGSTSQPDNPSVDTAQSRTASQTELPNLENVGPPPLSVFNDSQPGTISSSSIDVLGTLLSVAAAATAASLLTGTTEPMLPPNIGPPSYNSNSTSGRPAPNPPLRDSWAQSASPLPSNALGPGIGADPAAAGRAERLRQAWGSIRERLGLRPTPPPATMASLPGIEPEATPGLSSNDPRELVLAQMARAFNLGFGLTDGAATPANREGGEAEGSQPQQEAGSVTPQNGSSQLPADGSFERFLVDLQSDLRSALTSPHSPSGATSDVDPSPTPAPEGSSSMNTQNHTVGDFDRDASDSESEYQDAHDSGPENDDETTSAVSDTPRVSTSVNEPLAASNYDLPHAPAETGRAVESQDTDPQGRINWWRLYRFPPILTRTPSVTGIPASPSPSSPSPSVPSTSNTTLNPESATSATPPDVTDPTLLELPFADSDANRGEAQERTHTVVPVIVVGLQSVNTNWPATPNTEDNTGDLDSFGGLDEDGREDHADATPAAATNHNRTEPLDGTGRPAPSRGRAWHSRAAEALRNLRPGRRNRAAPAPTAPGSRTFLIYVIGGYYPPDHSIVTGGPDTLDSFEALLELAELLGQVKPPTVTKEDIEKSGLETIKTTQLEEYERENKISSNCVDRCLICLDDYRLEEDIRVMKCRHAFHKNCVDKWLETGRNNCPACRSRGVPLTSSDV